MQLIDPADQSSWPLDVRREVQRLAGLCRHYNTPSTRSYELSLGSADEGHKADRAFRNLLGTRPIALFHATRLLPHEREQIRSEGLAVLDENHRSRRLDRVIERYGSEIDPCQLELLRSAGPLTWNQAHRQGRLGRLFGVTPLQAAFDSAGKGMTVFLRNWGGESFYWAAENSPVLRAVVDELTARSAAAIVEVAAVATTLNWWTSLWPIFVSQLDGWPEPWHEFSTTQSIRPARVVTILDELSPRWPVT